MKRIVLSALAVAGVVAGSGAEPKFVAFGWDFPCEPSVVLKMADQFAATGLDGVSVGLPEMQNDSAMSPASFTREMAAKYVDDFRRFRDRPGLSESFVGVGWSPVPRSAPRLAWTNDAAWAHFAANMRTYAWLVKTSGLRGLFIDNEDYLRKRQFWREEGEPPYAQLKGVARRRGAEIGRAIFETHPDIVCVLFWILTIDPGYATALDPVAYRDMKEDLWPSFVDGLLDVMPDTATLVDGDEHGYVYVAEKHDFAEAVVARSRRLVSLLAPENQTRYRSRVKMGFGQYMDMYTNPEGSVYIQMPRNGSRLARFRENLAGALAAADGYIWFYGEKYRFVRWPEGCNPRPVWMKKVMREETWEEKLPGFAAMLRAAKNPMEALRQDLATCRRTDRPNLLAGALANTNSFWKADGVPLRFDFAAGKGRGGSTKISASGTGDGCVILSAGAVVTGEEYIGEIFVRGPCSRICLCWQKDDAWRWSVPAAEAVVGEPDAAGWRRAVMRAVVPQDIDGMVLKTDVSPREGETVSFDGASVYRAPADGL